MAIGAQAGHIVRGVTSEVFAMVVVGALAGFALSLASVQYIESLLYRVNPAEAGMLATPLLTIMAAAFAAALPAAVRAVRIDPAMTLRSE